MTPAARDILRRQIAAAVALGDRAAALTLGSRLTPTLCRAPSCQRQRRPDSPWCESCFRAIVGGGMNRAPAGVTGPTSNH